MCIFYIGIALVLKILFIMNLLIPKCFCPPSRSKRWPISCSPDIGCHRTQKILVGINYFLNELALGLLHLVLDGLTEYRYVVDVVPALQRNDMI